MENWNGKRTLRQCSAVEAVDTHDPLAADDPGKVGAEVCQ